MGDIEKENYCQLQLFQTNLREYLSINYGSASRFTKLFDC